MKRNFLWAILLPATILAQCSKDKNEKPAPDLKKGLLAYFEMNSTFYDSTKNVTAVTTSSQGVTPTLDRRYNVGALFCNGGKMTAQLDNWKASPITVSMWVVPGDDDANNYFLTTNDVVIGYFQEGTRMGFVVSHPSTNSAMAEAGDGTKWIHVAGTYDGKEIRTYINGQLKATQKHPGKPEVITSLTLGVMNNVYWKGALDDLRFYNRILTEEEITLLANQ